MEVKVGTGRTEALAHTALRFGGTGSPWSSPEQLSPNADKPLGDLGCGANSVSRPYFRINERARLFS